MNDIASIISSVGFPIVSFLISAWFINKTYDRQWENDAKYDEREEKHWNTISELTNAVNNNTETLKTLVENITKEDRNYDIKRNNRTPSNK